MLTLSIGEADRILGVSITTLRRWEMAGKLTAAFRTPGKHRRYSLNTLQEFMCFDAEDRINVAYARVPSYDQRNDLERQREFLVEQMRGEKETCEVISDLGSGLNENRKGLHKLLRMICQHKINKLCLTHRDRLARFGSRLLMEICALHGTQVIVLKDAQESQAWLWLPSGIQGILGTPAKGIALSMCEWAEQYYESSVVFAMQARIIRCFGFFYYEVSLHTYSRAVMHKQVYMITLPVTFL